jgi:hypothetical protein
MLHLLASAGILEQSYVAASIKKGGTYVRKPGVKKVTDNKGAYS